MIRLLVCFFSIFFIVHALCAQGYINSWAVNKDPGYLLLAPPAPILTTPTPDAFDRKLLKPLPKVEAPPPPPDVPFPPPPEAKLLKVQVGSMDPDNLQNQPQPIIVPPASPYGYPAAAPAYPGGWNPQGALMYLQQPIPGGGSSTSGSGLILPFQAPMVPPAPEPVHSGASYTEH